MTVSSEIQENLDRYTVTLVPGGAKVCLEVTVPLPADHQPVESVSLEQRAQILSRMRKFLD
jgi:hypothetical protein